MLPTSPEFSVIIVYNDWYPLFECLKSLRDQTHALPFEVVLVDNGSNEATPPEFMQQWEQQFPVISVRQPHTGIAPARNKGLKLSRASVLLFTDADCRLEANCLRNLGAVLANHPQHDCFQLNLAGDSSNVVGRAEELRLRTIQYSKMQPDIRTC
jgi:glycosyltransferase involved in cell wall biosynthesis